MKFDCELIPPWVFNDWKDAGMITEAQKNTEETIINHKETRIVKDVEAGLFKQ